MLVTLQDLESSTDCQILTGSFFIMTEAAKVGIHTTFSPLHQAIFDIFQSLERLSWSSSVTHYTSVPLRCCHPARISVAWQAQKRRKGWGSSMIQDLVSLMSACNCAGYRRVDWPAASCNSCVDAPPPSLHAWAWLVVPVPWALCSRLTGRTGTAVDRD